jgi:hypothetical protein
MKKGGVKENNSKKAKYQTKENGEMASEENVIWHQAMAAKYQRSVKRLWWRKYRKLSVMKA